MYFDVTIGNEPAGADLCRPWRILHMRHVIINFTEISDRRAHRDGALRQRGAQDRGEFPRTVVRTRLPGSLPSLYIICWGKLATASHAAAGAWRG